MLFVGGVQLSDAVVLGLVVAGGVDELVVVDVVEELVVVVGGVDVLVGVGGGVDELVVVGGATVNVTETDDNDQPTLIMTVAVYVPAVNPLVFIAAAT